MKALVDGDQLAIVPDDFEDLQNSDVLQWIPLVDVVGWRPPFYVWGRECREIAMKNGFQTDCREDGTLVALMHSELSEALEAMRRRDPADPHLPEFSSVEIEFADVLIRMLDFCASRGLDLEGALIAKIEFNRRRPFKHGDKEF